LRDIIVKITSTLSKFDELDSGINVSLRNCNLVKCSHFGFKKEAPDPDFKNIFFFCSFLKYDLKF
jgi:hypothetical protein